MHAGFRTLMRGKIIVEDGVPAPLHIVITYGNAVIGRAVSAADGRFVAEMAINGPLIPTVVGVEVQDRTRRCLASVQHSFDLKSDTPLAIKLKSVSPEHGVDLGLDRLLVDVAAAGRAAQKLADLESAGEAPPGSAAALRAALAPLEWATRLQVVARRALDGDPSAQQVMRAGLSAWAPASGLAIATAEVPDDLVDGAPHLDSSIFKAEGLVLLALGAVAAGRDDAERQVLLDGLAAAVWNMHWISRVEASLLGDSQQLQIMLGAAPLSMPTALAPIRSEQLEFDGLDDLGRPPEIKLPPKGPQIPGLGKSISIKVGHDIFAKFLVPHAVELPPIVKCMRDALAEVRKRQQELPKYQINGLDRPDACVGTEVTITGKNFGWFGGTGVVVFPGAEEPVHAETVLWWTDMSIRVVVPPGAIPGEIRLSILEGSIERCGLTHHIFREGTTAAIFSGGLPKLRVFVDYVQVDTICKPDQDISFSFDCTALPNFTVRATISNGATNLFDSGPLPGGTYNYTFRTPGASTPTDLLVRVVATGPCGSNVIQRTLTVAVQPNLTIAHIEVVQAIQRSDNSVRLASRRTTGVRVYVTSGLSGFSYTTSPNEVSNVTGTLEIYNSWPNIKLLGKVTATGLRVVGSDFNDALRARDEAAIDFVIPGHLLEEGDLSLWVSIKPNPLPHGMRDLPAVRKNLTLRFWRQSVLFVVAWRVQDDHPANLAPAPSQAQWDANFVGVRDRFPIGDANYLMRITPGFEVFSTRHNLRTVDGWEALIADLDDFADRFTDNGEDYVCITPSNAMYDLSGIAHDFEMWPRPWSDQHSIAIAQAGLTGTCAHELAHTYEVGHAPDQDPGQDPPEGIDPRIPIRTEPGAVGWRASDGTLFVDQPELMTYRTPPAPGTRNERWPSISTWNILFDRLN